MKNQLALSIIRGVLRPHHSLLRKEVETAGNLVGEVVIEQRPPLCRTLLPLHRLFEEFRCDLEEHLEVIDRRLYPRLFSLEAAMVCGERPLPETDDISECLRLVKHNQVTIGAVLEEMRELTHGFTSPVDACECYAELLDVLAGIQMEWASEIRMESMLFPAVSDLIEAARQCTALTF